ncbi:MAG: hypothetical protein AAFQ82_10870, partial [Myxococcota bacterium]
MRLLLTIGVVGLAAYMIYPSYFFYSDFKPRMDAQTSAADVKDEDKLGFDDFCLELPVGVPCSKFNLGLDLQGGVHLVMGVEVQKAVEQRLDRVSESLREAMKEKGIPFTRIDRPKDEVFFTVDLAPEANTTDLEKLLQLDFNVLDVEERSTERYTLKLLSDEEQFQRNAAVDQA